MSVLLTRMHGSMHVRADVDTCRLSMDRCADQEGCGSGAGPGGLPSYAETMAAAADPADLDWLDNGVLPSVSNVSLSPPPRGRLFSTGI